MLLAPDTVVPYLRARGLLHGDATASELGGGVSNVVLAVRGPEVRLLVKQSLPRLRVEDEWLAKRERALAEAAALEALAAIDPEPVPRLLDLDAEACALTTELAPDGWRAWKDLLLDGEVDAEVARRLGRVLASWQRAPVPPGFEDVEAFVQLRVDPYHRTLARRRPELAAPVLSCAERLLSDRWCLVHGDFSPKNVLVGDGRLWVIDLEVAHLGNGVFDVAFMLNHLFLKAIHHPRDAAGLRACALAFRDEVAPRDERDALAHVGCLMLARVHGKSPAEYLGARGRAAANALGESLLADPPPSLEAAWERLA